MSPRTRYCIVKGISADRVNEVIGKASHAMPGPPPPGSKWSDWRRVVTPKEFWGVITRECFVMIDDAWLFAKELAGCLNAPHLELRVQEGNHWDFTLYHAGEVVCDFSTNVAYFNSDRSSPRPWKQGDLESFARVWGVPREDVSPYLIDWGSLTAPRHVVASERFPTGDWLQVFDFMNAIGIQPPEEHPDKFSFKVPVWTETYRPQWWWWRIIRSISVRIKGTYPDVPQLTPEKRAI